MYCQCDRSARFIITHKGKTGYVCPNGRCSFYALAPEQCVGYKRVVPNMSNTVNSQLVITIVRFEALLHPETRHDAVMVHIEGKENKEVLSILHDAQYNGTWYTTREAYLFDLMNYKPLVRALTGLKYVAVEEIPNFFFRCLEKARAIVRENIGTLQNSALVDANDYVMQQLRPFQRQGVEFVISHGGRAMIADDMGLGKTVQAIAIAHHYRSEWPVLIVCPMSLMENWLNEFNKFCGISFSRMTILQGTKPASSNTIAEYDIIVVSYSSLKSIEAHTFQVIVLDESHFIKDSDAKRTRLAIQLCHRAKRVILLTGTPAMSRPIELYAQLITLQPSIMPSKYLFAARYCNSYRSNFGVDMTGHSHIDELHFLLENFIIRRTKKELGAELPSKTRQLLYIHVTERERKQLETQVSALRKSINARSGFTNSTSSSNSNNNNSNEFTSLCRAPNAFELKSATAHAKIPAVQDYVSRMVEQHVENNEKVILFAHHTCMMEAIRGAVMTLRPKHPLDYIYITGETSALQREEQVNHFRNESTCHVAILSMQSSGTGHNLTCASTVIFAELDWNPSTHLQCEDRVHRMGQSTPCTIKYLLAEGTADAVIWPLLQSKLTVTRALLASDARQLVEQSELLRNANTHKIERTDTANEAEASALMLLEHEQQSTLDGFVSVQKTPTTSTMHHVINDNDYSDDKNKVGTESAEVEIITTKQINNTEEEQHLKEEEISEITMVEVDLQDDKVNNNSCCTPVQSSEIEKIRSNNKKINSIVNTLATSASGQSTNHISGKKLNSDSNSSNSNSPSKNTPTTPRIVISLAEMEERKVARRTTAAALFKHTSPTLSLTSQMELPITPMATSQTSSSAQSSFSATTENGHIKEPLSVIAMMRKSAHQTNNCINGDCTNLQSQLQKGNKNNSNSTNYSTLDRSKEIRIDVDDVDEIANKRFKHEDKPFTDQNTLIVHQTNINDDNTNHGDDTISKHNANVSTTTSAIPNHAEVKPTSPLPALAPITPPITSSRRRTTFTIGSLHSSETPPPKIPSASAQEMQASVVTIPIYFHNSCSNSNANYNLPIDSKQSSNIENNDNVKEYAMTSVNTNENTAKDDNTCTCTTQPPTCTRRRTIIKLNNTKTSSLVENVNTNINNKDYSVDLAAPHVWTNLSNINNNKKENTCSVINKVFDPELIVQSTNTTPIKKDNDVSSSSNSRSNSKTRTLFKFHINDSNLHHERES